MQTNLFLARSHCTNKGKCFAQRKSAYIANGFFTLLLLLAVLITNASETPIIYASDVKVPILDPNSGKLSKQIIAARAEGPENALALVDLTVFFYSANGPGAATQKLVAPQAVFNNDRHTLTGDGPIILYADDGRTASGVGFNFDLWTNHLRLFRQCRLESDKFLTTSDRGEVFFTPNSVNHNSAIRHFSLEGDVVLIPRANGSTMFERLQTSRAWSNEKEEIIHLASPVLGIKGGKEFRMNSNDIEIKK